MDLALILRVPASPWNGELPRTFPNKWSQNSKSGQDPDPRSTAERAGWGAVLRDRAGARPTRRSPGRPRFRPAPATASTFWRVRQGTTHPPDHGPAPADKTCGNGWSHPPISARSLFPFPYHRFEQQGSSLEIASPRPCAAFLPAPHNRAVRARARDRPTGRDCLTTRRAILFAPPSQRVRLQGALARREQLPGPATLLQPRKNSLITALRRIRKGLCLSSAQAHHRLWLHRSSAKP